MLQLDAGETLAYNWYPSAKDPRLLFDVVAELRSQPVIRPGVTKPIFDFELLPEGGWELRIEVDGRDGLAGGLVADDYDWRFSHRSAGARPYSVAVDPQESHWALSAISPGGKPHRDAQVALNLKPLDRQSGESLTPGAPYFVEQTAASQVDSAQQQAAVPLGDG